MLACDASHPFSGTQEAFPSRYRTNSFMSEVRDLSSYDTMFTEGEAKDMSVKFSSSPTQIMHAPSPNQPTADAAQVPPLTQADTSATSLNDPKERETNMTSPISSHRSPAQTSGSPTHDGSSQVSSDSHHMMHLLQQRQQQQQQQHEQDVQRNQQQYHHQQQRHQQQQQQQQQQPRQHYKELELDLTQDKGGNYSDSDSSGPPGVLDPDGTYNSRRFREFVPDTLKNELYWEKRRRNNEAARRSREKRRMQDMALEGRISCLETDNGRLRRELSILKKRYNLPEDQNFDDQMEQDVKDIRPPSSARMSPPPLSTPNPSMHSSSALVAANNNAPANRSHPETTPYTSPPPLLAVASAIQMGMAVYPSPGPPLPYFFSEASRMNQEARGGGLAHGIPSLPASHHLNPATMRRNSIYPHLDNLKQEKHAPEEAVRVRGRSNSNVIDCRPSYQMDMPDVQAPRRGSVGNYIQYGRPVSPSSACHQAYPSSLANRANPGHFLQRPYDPIYSQYSWSQQRSPASSHSSDDNYDEPLQLTVRRDSTLSTNSTQSNTGMEDTSSRESDQGASIVGDNKHNITPGSPPASSFPLKLRHKLPPHDIYPKEVFPNISPSAPPAGVATSQASFPAHPFINGLAHLSDMAVGQNNPLSLIKKENFRQRRDSNRSMARRNPLDHKYMDPKYLERRRRNNEAARKCRENRKTLTRIREVKSDYLENENNKLRDELNGLQEEMKHLRELIEKKRIEKGIAEDMDQKSPLPPQCNDGERMDTEMYVKQ